MGPVWREVRPAGRGPGPPGAHGDEDRSEGAAQFPPPPVASASCAARSALFGNSWRPSCHAATASSIGLLPVHVAQHEVGARVLGVGGHAALLLDDGLELDGGALLAEDRRQLRATR